MNILSTPWPSSLLTSRTYALQASHLTSSYKSANTWECSVYRRRGFKLTGDKRYLGDDYEQHHPAYFVSLKTFDYMLDVHICSISTAKPHIELIRDDVQLVHRTPYWSIPTALSHQNEQSTSQRNNRNSDIHVGSISLFTLKMNGSTGPWARYQTLCILTVEGLYWLTENGKCTSFLGDAAVLWWYNPILVSGKTTLTILITNRPALQVPMKCISLQQCCLSLNKSLNCSNEPWTWFCSQ